MARLAIRKVIYEGDNYFFESPLLKDGLIILSGGDNGVGKTTFSELIFYGLGGYVEQFRSEGSKKLDEITDDDNNFVKLEIELDSASYSVTRFINDNTIAIEGDGDEIKQLPVNRQNNCEIFSDWILEKLGLAKVEYYAGPYTKFTLGLSQFMRLLYHDQSSDNTVLYMKGRGRDAGEYVESKRLRKAIFEILTGSSFNDYHKLIGELALLDKSKREKQSSINNLEKLANKLGAINQDENLASLKNKREELESQLELLEQSRVEAGKKEISTLNLVEGLDTEKLKSKILELEMGSSDLDVNYLSLLKEMSDLKFTSREISSEIRHVRKILFSHEQLSLFSDQTCPVCLREVDVPADHCLCGQRIDVGDYQRLTYSSKEYLKIINSKLKTLKTLEVANTGCREELDSIKKSKDDIEVELDSLKEELSKGITSTFVELNTKEIDAFSEKIFEVKSKIDSLDKKMSLEEEMEADRKDLYTAETNFKAKEREVKAKEISIEALMEKVIKDCSRFYNDMVTSTISKVKWAKIDQDYEPILSKGYIPASYYVHKRLLYFLSLLKVGVTDDGIPHPRFLLIDTPRTAGIEVENLKDCIKQIERLGFDKDDDGNDVAVEKVEPYQIILTSDKEDYPEEYSTKVFLHIKKGDHLLQKKENAE